MADHNLLNQFLHFALEATHAERGLTVNPQMNVLERVQMEEGALDLGSANPMKCISLAYAADEMPFVTNNIFHNNEDTPSTNQGISNLRLVVVFVMGEHGAVYIDNLVSQGVLSKETIQRLGSVAQAAQQHDPASIDKETLHRLYRAATPN